MRMLIGGGVGLFTITVGLAVAAGGCNRRAETPPPGAVTQALGTVGTDTPSHACAATAANAGTPRAWQGGGFGFNPCTGNLQLAVGFAPSEHQLVWNSLRTDDVGFGVGWTADFYSTMTQNGGNLTFLLPDGTQKTYAQNGSNYLPVDPQDPTSVVASGGTFIVKAPGGGQAIYSQPNGNGWFLTQTVDRQGNTTTIQFNTANQPAAIIDWRGLTTQLTWSAGHLTQLTDPDGRTHTLSYDASNQLTSVQHPAVAAGTPTEQFAYDPGNTHLIVATTDPAGATNDISYNADRTWASTTTPDSQTMRADYFDGETILTDGLGNKTILNFSNGGLVAETAPNGQQSKLVRDSRQRVTQTIDPYGRTESFAYDGADNVTSYTDPDGLTTTAVYDDGNADPTHRHNLLSTTSPTGKTESFTYGANDQIASETNALGETTTYNLDTKGNVLSVVDFAGKTRASYVYNSRGQVTSATDAYGQTQTFTYDTNANLVSTAAPGNVTQSRTVTAMGLTTSITDPTNKTVSYALDPLGRATTTTLSDGKTIDRAFNLAGQVTQLTDQSGPNTLSSSWSYRVTDKALVSASVNGIATQTAPTTSQAQSLPPPSTCVPSCPPGATSDGCGGTCGAGGYDMSSGSVDMTSCAPSGATCTGSSQCCSGVCNFSPTGDMSPSSGTCG